MLLYVCLIAGAVVCAAQAIHASKLLPSSLWLAGVSVLLSIVFYLMGATQIAVIELSVGAGLITVLFVFAISVAGDDAIDPHSIVPMPVAGFLVAVALGLIGLQLLPLETVEVSGASVPFAQMLWEERGLDMMVQIVMIFAGVVGVLGLIGQSSGTSETDSHHEEQEEYISDVVTREHSLTGRPDANGSRPVRAVDVAQPD